MSEQGPGIEGLSNRDRKSMKGNKDKGNKDTDGPPLGYNINDEVEKTNRLKAALTRQANRALGRMRKVTSPETTGRSVTAEAERVLKKENKTQEKTMKRAEKIVDKVAEKEQDVKKSPIERQPMKVELPKPETFNLENVIEKVMTKWGQTPKEIMTNLEKAENSDVFRDLTLLIDARSLDLALQDGALQTDPKTTALKDQIEAGYKALILDKDNPNVHIKASTGERVVEVTSKKNEDGTISAKVGHTPGELYYSFTPGKIGYAKQEIGQLETEIACLTYAREAALSQITGAPLEIDPDDEETAQAPELDYRVQALNVYLLNMREEFEATRKALKDPKQTSDLKLTDEQVETVKGKADLLFALFDGFDKKKPEWKTKKGPKELASI